MRISYWSSDVCSSDLLELDIDVAARSVSLPDGRRYPFPLDAFAQACLLEGTDQLGYLLQQHADITRYEELQHARRSEEHTSELQSLMRISYAVFCLKNKIKKTSIQHHNSHQTLINTYELKQ